MAATLCRILSGPSPRLSREEIVPAQQVAFACAHVGREECNEITVAITAGCIDRVHDRRVSASRAIVPENPVARVRQAHAALFS